MLAMLGRFHEARALLVRTRADLSDRGGGVLLANVTAFQSVWVELWAGDPAAAAGFAAEGWSLYETLGERGFLSAAAGLRGQALYALDRLEEADEWAARAEALATDERWSRAIWREVRAKLLARHGACDEAKQIAGDAVTLCSDTNHLNAQGDAFADLAEVLSLCGDVDGARETLQQARECYERERVADRLAELGAPAGR